MSLKHIASKFSFPHPIHILLNIRIILRSIIHVHPQDTETFSRKSTAQKNPHRFCQTNIILPQSCFTTKHLMHFADHTKTKNKSVIRYYHKNWATQSSNQTADLAPAFSSPPNWPELHRAQLCKGDGIYSPLTRSTLKPSSRKLLVEIF